MELYLLVMCESKELSPLATRIIEVDRKNGKFDILRSEYDYLGEGIISAEIDEDEFGLNYFSFTSNEDEPRQFICEDDENSEYINGVILSNDDETGEFILRNISKAELP